MVPFTYCDLKYGPYVFTKTEWNFYKEKQKIVCWEEGEKTPPFLFQFIPGHVHH